MAGMMRTRLRIRAVISMVAIICALPLGWIAYQLNWIRQRHEFLLRERCYLRGRVSHKCALASFHIRREIARKPARSIDSGSSRTSTVSRIDDHKSKHWASRVMIYAASRFSEQSGLFMQSPIMPRGTRRGCALAGTPGAARFWQLNIEPAALLIAEAQGAEPARIRNPGRQERK